MPRPTDYKTEYCEQGYKLCLLGATDAEMASFFNVAESTINKWKLDYPEFSESIKKGKVQADAVVASKLFHRATGYEHPEVDIKLYQGTIIKTDLVKHYPPDTTAAIFWLKNRQKEKWRDRQDMEHTGRDGTPIETNTSITYMPKQLPDEYWKNGGTTPDPANHDSQ